MNMKDVKKYLGDLEKILSDNWWISIIIILLLLFAPSTCNGVTHYTGIRGCSTDNNQENEENDTPGKNKMFFNMITY